MKTLYEATTKAEGGRTGSIKSEDDGPLEHNLSVPKSMGGNGGNGTNPEQLFGAAYAACFGGALQSVAKNEGIEIDEEALSVTAIIGFCKDEDGFFLEATLDCYIPGVDLKTGEDLVEKAHEACPFSKATRDNITVTLNLLIDE
ncbi:Ohr family peroxiredoxin [Winogradskyella thalassocola]|uniref:Peroxiredoxin, Ohr subfamily n=1 Tax=Winogradskyella thalassocola TaxID=262004 RepID=A0A1G8FBQ9_9FLAO|nr:Ohr family peroxiredoxin [Winogradskyella thalassocola]SDH79543.1 peroxiredoxin, Ohr subfamily [Winogradskyella thalassocola]